MIDAYPLCWPEGWPRIALRERSQFRITPDRARKNLLEEVRRLVGPRFRRDRVIISTDIRLRQDGEPYSSQRALEDTGVAVYFEYKDKSMVFACDRWHLLHDNIHAVGKTIEALRGIERWGASDMLDRAFTGFTALEQLPDEGWRDVLQMGNDGPDSNMELLKRAERHYKILAKEAHPDHGGSADGMIALNNARQQARRELK